MDRWVAQDDRRWACPQDPYKLVLASSPVATPSPHIGTLREKPLHRSLKDWYFQDGDRVEVPVDGYVIDLVRGDLLIEIQTRGFSSMRSKLEALLGEGHRMRIVHPIPSEKWIVKVSDDGEILDRRRSPKHGKVTDVFSELVSFPAMVVDCDLEVEVLITHEEEFRHHTPGRSWRRKGWSVLERRLIDVVDRVVLADRPSLVSLMPERLPTPFTTVDVAAGLGQPRRIAQQMAYCLREAAVIEVVGKVGNAVQYSIA